MTVLRRIFGIAAATMLAMLTLPAGAASTDNKFFHAIFPAIIPSGTGIQVPVTLVNDSPPPGLSTINSFQIVAPPGSGVTITGVSPGTPSGLGTATVTVNNIPGIRRGESRTFTVTLDVPSNLTCVPGTWDVAARTGNAFPQGDTFLKLTATTTPPAPAGTNYVSLLGCSGVLACQGQNPPPPGTVLTFPISEDTNSTTVKRWTNKDGSACDPLPFSADIERNGRELILKWQFAQYPFIALETETEWPVELVHPVTRLPRPTQWRWADTDPFVTAPTCLASDPPRAYGTLFADVNGSQPFVDMTPDPANPTPPVPFPIVIRSDTGTAVERMQVTNVTDMGSFVRLDVTRPTGGTFADAHTGARPVMSTPIPVLASGQQSRVCIIEENFLTQPASTPACRAEQQTPGNEDLGCFRGTTRLFIVDDPIVSRNY